MLKSLVEESSPILPRVFTNVEYSLSDEFVARLDSFSLEPEARLWFRVTVWFKRPKVEESYLEPRWIYKPGAVSVTLAGKRFLGSDRDRLDMIGGGFRGEHCRMVDLQLRLPQRGGVKALSSPVVIEVQIPELSTALRWEVTLKDIEVPQ